MRNSSVLSLIAFILSFSFVTAFAQHEPVFPDLSGDELLDELVDAYRPQITLSYGQARDTLYGNIDSPNDSLRCVYTGYTIYLDPTLDPTTAAFQNDGPDAINTEHTYPQGLGASGVLRADMHNFYPCRKDVNSERGSDPFAEIADSQTDTWWRDDQNQNSIPGANIDEYSEERDGQFEPREDHKGNVARSMFYFYAMYKAEADAQSDTYFASQVETLCDWHIQDPVDFNEFNRTKAIAEYQDNKENPYVLDCTLAERTHCQGLILCTPLSTDENVADELTRLEQNFPNPFETTTRVRYFLGQNYQVRLSVLDLFGKELHVLVNEKQQAGGHVYQLEKNENWGSGVFVLRMEIEKEGVVQVFSKKLVAL